MVLPPPRPAVSRRRVCDRPRPGAAAEAAEQLGQALPLEVRAGLGKAGEDAEHLILQAIACEAQGDQGIVVRPDRAVVV